MSQQRKLIVIGQGYVGLPLAMRAAEVGYQVVGLDTDENRIKTLAAGSSYVEDIEPARVRAALDAGTFVPTTSYTDCEGFDLAVITVPTPLRESIPDLSYMETAARDLAPHIRPGATVVLESTTYPGTTEELVAPILEAGSGLTAGHDFHLGYSPERIDPGNTTWTLETTPKVVAGLNDASLTAIKRFYDDIVVTTVPVGSPRTAELTKLLENTFRHVNIALVNELAVFANDLGVDVWEAIDAAATKPFGFMKFTPGPGVGGHCLPVDPSYLSWQVRRQLGYNFRFVELANDVNDHMPNYVARRVTAGLNARKLPVNGSRILLLGLSYKKNTGDPRESPATRVAELLLEMGADLHAVDPFVETHLLGPGLKLVPLTLTEVEQADAVIILTDHDTFDYAMVSDRASYVFDARHRATGPDVEYL